METKLEIGNLTDVGKKRTANEDYFGAYQGPYGDLIIVCDGMGGNKSGALASRISVEMIKEHFEKLPKEFDPKEELRISLEKADLALKEKAELSEELKEMGSTAVVLLIKDNMAYTTHIGDSRIYMIRRKKAHQLTKDHSLMEQMIDANIITREAAKEHPNKNVITRSLGADGSSEPEVAEPFALFKNDRFILCTDGLTAYADENELLQITLESAPQEACQKLIQLANDRGGKDNITVQIVAVKKGKHLPLPNPVKDKQIKLISGITLLSVFIVAITFIFFFPVFSSDSPDGPVTLSDTTKYGKEGFTNKLKMDSLGLKPNSKADTSMVMQLVRKTTNTDSVSSKQKMSTIIKDTTTLK